MKEILLVGSGSFIGGVGRYLLSQLIQSRLLTPFPFGTLGVNIIGCFIIGLIFGVSDKAGMSNDWKLFLAAGICGGFTTFSAFSNETFGLLRGGNWLFGFYYVAASVLLGLLATLLGFMIVKWI